MAIEAYLQQQVTAWLALAEAAEQTVIPAKMNINDEIERRPQRLAPLAAAKAVWEKRAQARDKEKKRPMKRSFANGKQRRPRKVRTLLDETPNHQKRDREIKTRTTSPTRSRPS